MSCVMLILSGTENQISNYLTWHLFLFGKTFFLHFASAGECDSDRSGRITQPKDQSCQQICICSNISNRSGIFLWVHLLTKKQIEKRGERFWDFKAPHKLSVTLYIDTHHHRFKACFPLPAQISDGSVSFLWHMLCALMDSLHVNVSCIYAERFSFFIVKRSGKKAMTQLESVCLSISTSVSLHLVYAH